MKWREASKLDRDKAESQKLKAKSHQRSTKNDLKAERLKLKAKSHKGRRSTKNDLHRKGLDKCRDLFYVRKVILSRKTSMLIS